MVSTDPTNELISRLDHLRTLHWNGTRASDVWLGLMRLSSDAEHAASLVPPGVARAVRGVLARTLGIAGTIAFIDLDNHNAAERALLRGLAAARKSDDSRLIAWIYGKLAHRRIYDYGGNRVAILREALQYTEYAERYSDDSPAVRAFLSMTKGETLAALGRESAIWHVDIAGSTMESLSSDTAPDWLSNFDEARVRSQLGACWLRLDKPKYARHELDVALAGIGENYSHKAVVLADAARAYAQTGEPERASGLLTSALPIVARSHSAVRQTRIRAARNRLQPWAHEPFVVELDEAIHASGLS